jgi:hypothetical protein
MKIFSQAIATGKEWKPCVECGGVFEEGEVITSIATDNNFGVSYWYCSKCFDGWGWSVPLYDHQEDTDRIDRFFELEGMFYGSIFRTRHTRARRQQKGIFYQEN